MRRIQVSWRRAKARCADFISVDVVPRSSCGEADRGARGAGHSSGFGGPHVVGGAGADHGVDALVDARGKRSRSMVRPTSVVG